MNLYFFLKKLNDFFEGKLYDFLREKFKNGKQLVGEVLFLKFRPLSFDFKFPYPSHPPSTSPASLSRSVSSYKCKPETEFKEF